MLPNYIYTPARIVQHCAIDGRLETEVRAYRIDPQKAASGNCTAVCITFLRPRKRTPASYRLVSNNIRYATVEVDGKVVYDTRQDVPCDMEQWEATNREWRAKGGSIQQ